MPQQNRASHINGYRQGVIAVLIHPVTGHVLAGKRKNPTHAGSWQFPQGGIEDGHTELETALEEVKQETGITLPSDTFITCTDFTTRCTYDDGLSERNGLGQDHRWFFFAYEGEAKLFDPEDDEFSKVKWKTFREVILLTPKMRRPGYNKAYKFYRQLQALC